MTVIPNLLDMRAVERVTDLAQHALWPDSSYTPNVVDVVRSLDGRTNDYMAAGKLLKLFGRVSRNRFNLSQV